MGTFVNNDVTSGNIIYASDHNEQGARLAAVINGGLDSTNISSLDGSKINSATLPAAAMASSVNPNTLLGETISPFVNTGCVWSSVSGLNGTMTAGVIYTGPSGVIYRVSVSSVSSHAFTASKDTYIDIDNSGTITYSAVSNGAAAPALTANSIRVALIVTNGSAITTVTQSGRDSNNVQIYPTSPILPLAWQSWTPTFTNLSGGTLTYAKYIQIGKTVHFRLFYTLAGANVSGSVSFTLPVMSAAGNSNEIMNGMVHMVRTSTAGYPGFMIYSNSTTVIIQAILASGTYASDQGLSATVPNTWGANDTISCEGTYEAA